MITAHEESFKDCYPELSELLQGHHEELALNQDKISLNPDLQVYYDREDDGSLVFCTIRDKGLIVGYYIGFVVTSLHNKDHLTCHTDIFYVHPDARGYGAGKILFGFCEKLLKNRGIARWIVASKNHKKSVEFLEKSGFEPIETVLCKVLLE